MGGGANHAEGNEGFCGGKVHAGGYGAGKEKSGGTKAGKTLSGQGVCVGFSGRKSGPRPCRKTGNPPQIFGGRVEATIL